MSHFARHYSHTLDTMRRDAQRRGDRDPRYAEDLHLPGFAQRLRTAKVSLKMAQTRIAIENILQPLWQALEDARRRAEQRGDIGRELAARRGMANIHRLYDRAEEGLR